jgi:hypothetical protein
VLSTCYRITSIVCTDSIEGTGSLDTVPEAIAPHDRLIKLVAEMKSGNPLGVHLTPESSDSTSVVLTVRSQFLGRYLTSQPASLLPSIRVIHLAVDEP